MTATRLRRIFYDCPSWCERTDHEADYVGPGHLPSHYGPEFGLIYVQGQDAEEPWATIPDEPDPFNTEALRRLARDAVAPAEWIEAHR